MKDGFMDKDEKILCEKNGILGDKIGRNFEIRIEMI